jgi:hypothetical protein
MMFRGKEFGANKRERKNSVVGSRRVLLESGTALTVNEDSFKGKNLGKRSNMLNIIFINLLF